jgi:hypothetical protein
MSDDTLFKDTLVANAREHPEWDLDQHEQALLAAGFDKWFVIKHYNAIYMVARRT